MNESKKTLLTICADAISRMREIGGSRGIILIPITYPSDNPAERVWLRSRDADEFEFICDVESQHPNIVHPSTILSSTSLNAIAERLNAIIRDL